MKIIIFPYPFYIWYCHYFYICQSNSFEIGSHFLLFYLKISLITNVIVHLFKFSSLEIDCSYFFSISSMPFLTTIHSLAPWSVPRRLTFMDCINGSLALWLLVEFGQPHLPDWEVTVAEFFYQRLQILSRFLFYSSCILVTIPFPYHLKLWLEVIDPHYCQPRI